MHAPCLRPASADNEMNQLIAVEILKSAGFAIDIASRLAEENAVSQ